MLIILENQDTGVVKTQSNGFLQVSAGKRKKRVADRKSHLPKHRNNSFLWPFLETEVNSCTYFLNKTF